MTAVNPDGPGRAEDAARVSTGSSDTVSESWGAGIRVGFLGLGTMGGPMCRRLDTLLD